MGGKKPLRRPLWPPTRATASNYYPLGLDGAGGAAKPLLRAPKKPAPLHGRLPAFSGAVDAFERTRKCYLEWRYFFSIILSEFLKNRVALQRSSSKCAAYHSGFSREDAIFVISIQVATKEHTCVFAFMFQNGKFLLYSLGVHPNFFRKASLKWLMLLYPTNPAMSFT